MKDAKFLIPMIFFLLLVSYFKSFPIPSDEMIYINMAKNVAANNLFPYKDFFYAHPPMQLFLLSSIFKIFGSSYIVVKVYQTFVALLILFLTCRISKKLFGSCLISALFLSLNPIFLLFANLSIGFWEASLLILLSFLLILDRKETIASITFALSVFTRYLSLPFFIPLFILATNRRKFLLCTIVFSLALFSPLLMFDEFLKDTIYYHFQKVSPSLTINWQYWSFGIFNSLILLPATYYSYSKNNKKQKIFYIFSFALIFELTLAFSLKQLIYHYFVLSLPYVALSANYLYYSKKFLRVFVLATIVFNLIFNLPSIEYYFDKRNFEELNLVNNFIEQTKAKEIFGEPIITNYISFQTNTKIKNNVFDTDLKRINFDPTEILDALKQKPSVIVDRKNYLESVEIIKKILETNYRVIFKTKEYIVYELR